MKFAKLYTENLHRAVKCNFSRDTSNLQMKIWSSDDGIFLPEYEKILLIDGKSMNAIIIINASNTNENRLEAVQVKAAKLYREIC